MMPPKKSMGQPTGPRWKWIIGIVGLLWLGGVVSDLTRIDDPPAAYENVTDYSENYLATSDPTPSPSVPTTTYTPTPSAPSNASAGSGVSQVDRTLLPSERENYAQDPSSHGFSADDRAFLQEHGVTESQARAIETITREQGVR